MHFCRDLLMYPQSKRYYYTKRVILHRKLLLLEDLVIKTLLESKVLWHSLGGASLAAPSSARVGILTSREA